MVYCNQLVAVVVTQDGKFAREFKENGDNTVYLPFGTEYGLKFKNMNSRRVAVSVDIDGTDVLGGTQLVIDGNSTSELQGFLDANSNVAKNAFRFIEKTDKIRDHRGDRMDDGLIRVQFQFEEPKKTYPHWLYNNPWYNQPWVDPSKPNYPNTWPYRHPDIIYGPIYKGGPHTPTTSSGILRSQTMGFGSSCGSYLSSPSKSINNVVTDNLNDSGITVTGSRINQNFDTTHLGRMDPAKHVVIIHLKGKAEDSKPIQAVRTSRQKIKCPSCGINNRSSAKFCEGCTTGLI